MKQIYNVNAIHVKEIQPNARYHYANWLLSNAICLFHAHLTYDIIASNVKEILTNTKEIPSDVGEIPTKV